MDSLIESASVSYHPASDRDALVAALDRPWIADEGALDIGLRRRQAGETSLRARGVAFDEGTTVHWDEDAVQLVRKAAPESGVLAFESEVLVRDFLDPRPSRMFRIDYLQAGVLLGSRYVAPATQEPRHA